MQLGPGVQQSLVGAVRDPYVALALTDACSRSRTKARVPTTLLPLRHQSLRMGAPSGPTTTKLGMPLRRVTAGHRGCSLAPKQPYLRRAVRREAGVASGVASPARLAA